jgi:hypothetical protein
VRIPHLSTETSRASEIASAEMRAEVRRVVGEQPIWDVHTHLYPPAFGTTLGGRSHDADPHGLLSWGIDELLTYHYLVAEVFRAVPASELPYETFWSMTRAQQAEHIWKNLFLERSPLSEACRGVLTTLQRLGLDPDERSLDRYRLWFAEQDVDSYIDRVMELSGVSRITMTNDVFDDNERGRWLADPSIASDSRFAPVLRIDPLLCDWSAAARQLSSWGYQVSDDLDARTLEEARRFFREWLNRTQAVYSAVSLPPSFQYLGPDDRSYLAVVLRQIVLPVLAERGLPMALMIGVKRRVNPALRDAGDMLGLSDLANLARLCLDFPQNRFLVTVLARENQHELAVIARKFGNLTIFGCWWFLNTPSLMREITQMRLELLGTTFIPQHSDARVLDQLIYKWDHSRAVIGDVLADKYAALEATGWTVRAAELRRDVDVLLRGNAATLLG